MYRGIHNLQFVDQRAFQRIKVDLRGRFLLFNGAEYDCIVREMSPGGLFFSCENSVALIGERSIVFVEKIGRIEGEVISFDSRGCAVRIIASEQSRRKLAEKITWIANQDDLQIPDQRRYDRGFPREIDGQLMLEDKTIRSCQIIDLSESGVSINVDYPVKVSSVVWFNGIQGHVIRSFSGGIAIEFSAVQEREKLGLFL
ncbi:MAG: PilZ domain-containing protein [Candidatus Liberibacter ctenarytainae]|uniref:PilZ domain-containing protein n=1 Tax=Candidatus Liberibacter ctenarytainae TaxID=2020335 RepID=A0A937AQN3_9HYPH|nr:PilZ domain-containing protein [Candidatus Liberibacter ctenarytainae]